MKMIVGWKSIAQATGFHMRTVKRWHYEREPIPFKKTSSAQQGKIMIEESQLREWLNSIGKKESATMPRR